MLPALQSHATISTCQQAVDLQSSQYGLEVISGALEGLDWIGHSGGFQGVIARAAIVPDWGVTVSIVTNSVDGLANSWVDGVLGIMQKFAMHGPAETATTARIVKANGFAAHDEPGPARSRRTERQPW